MAEEFVASQVLAVGVKLRKTEWCPVLKEMGLLQAFVRNHSELDFSSYEKTNTERDIANGDHPLMLPSLCRRSCLCVKMSSFLLEKEKCMESGRI